MRNTGTIRGAALLVVLLLSLGGVCFAGAGFHEPAPQTQHVLIQGFKYHPDVLTVHVGDTVIWKNTDIVAHTVTAVDRSFDSGKIAPGASWSLVVKKAGTFLYKCTPHPNMHGKLIVQ